MSGEERTVLFQLPTMISGQLVCTQGTLAGRSWNLSAGTFVIGRAQGCDLTLSAEPGVSKLHAKIIAEGDHYSLVDNESRNGTIVNGRPIQKAALKTGDQIRICNCVLRFTQTGAGMPLSAEGAPVAAAADHGMDEVAATSPEVQSMTAAGPPPSVEAPRPASAPDPRELAPIAPTQELPAASVELPRPAPEVRVRSAMPWFVIGLVGMVVLGGAGWGGLRVFGDELLGPPAALADARAAKDPIALEREAEEARAKAAADRVEAAEDVKRAAADTREPTTGDGAALDDGQGAPDEPPDDEPPADEEVVAADDGRGAADDLPDEPPADDEDEDVQVATADTPPAATARRPKAKAPDESAEPTWHPVTVEREGPIAVKARSGGKVASVAAGNGQTVRRGEVLLSFEASGGSSDEISNLRANIEALEAVAESQPSAQEMLEREKDKLKRLLAKSGDGNVTAPVAGTLTSFTVKAGDVVKAGDTVGVIERGGTTLVVTVPAAEGRRIKRGASVELKTKAGTASGRVASVKRRGASYQVVLSTDASANDVVEARF